MNKWNAPAHNASSTSLVWLISFGDLLTLLVCFFLVLTPWHSFKTGSGNRNAFIPGASDRTPSDGTPLANSSVGPKVGVVSDVPIEHSQFGDEVRAKLFKTTLVGALMSPEAMNAAVRVRVCSASGFEETLRSVMSIITEQKREKRRVSIELLGDCERVEVLYPTSAAVVGSVRLVRE
jgi:hypothetical protein